MDVGISRNRAARVAVESLGPEDFETASIRSAAPSYNSEAPSYHSNGHIHEPIPAYSPAGSASAPTGTPQAPAYSAPPLLSPAASSSSSSAAGRRPGLPPVPTGPVHAEIPSLANFRISSWSNMSANPTARHYHNVAHRRLARATDTSNLDAIKRFVQERAEEEERNRSRPLEDPHLVGEEAAARARQERLARDNGVEILIREDGNGIGSWESWV